MQTIKEKLIEEIMVLIDEIFSKKFDKPDYFYFSDPVFIEILCIDLNFQYQLEGKSFIHSKLVKNLFNQIKFSFFRKEKRITFIDTLTINYYLVASISFVELKYFLKQLQLLELQKLLIELTFYEQNSEWC
jgi:hypothetical protein